MEKVTRRGKSRSSFIGVRFGKLLIISDEEDKVLPSGHYRRMVKCVCDCGNETVTSLTDIKRGRTRSCGCSTFVNTLTTEERSEQSKRLYESGKFPHLGKGKSDEFTPFRYLLKSTKNKDRRKENNLTLSYLKYLWEKQEGRCCYTGVELQLPTHTNNLKELPSYKKASVDRIDSTLGYTEGNVQIVSQAINSAKGIMTHDEMIEFLEIIRSHPSHFSRE